MTSRGRGTKEEEAKYQLKVSSVSGGPRTKPLTPALGGSQLGREQRKQWGHKFPPRNITRRFLESMWDSHWGQNPNSVLWPAQSVCPDTLFPLWHWLLLFSPTAAALASLLILTVPSELPSQDFCTDCSPCVEIHPPRYPFDLCPHFLWVSSVQKPSYWIPVPIPITVTLFPLSLMEEGGTASCRMLARSGPWL